jgi:hypothetical protein
MKGRATSCRLGPPLFCPCFTFGFSYLEALGVPSDGIIFFFFFFFLEEVSWPRCKVRFPHGVSQRGEAANYRLAVPSYRICCIMMGP